MTFKTEESGLCTAVQDYCCKPKSDDEYDEYYGNYDDYLDLNIKLVSRPKTCGERRKVDEYNGDIPGLAGSNEFPWTCIIMGEGGTILGGCVIVPDKSNNDISKGSSKVITAAHKFFYTPPFSDDNREFVRNPNR